MQLITIRILPDSSLFCKFPCILVTFSLGATNNSLLETHDESVQKIATDQLSKIGLDMTVKPSPYEVPLPSDINLVKSLIEDMMTQVDLSCGETCVVYDDISNRLHIAFPEKDRLLTSHIIKQSIRYVISLYMHNKQKMEENTFYYLRQLKYTLDKHDYLGKTRTAKEIQYSLIGMNKPWFPLDFDTHHKNWIQLGFGRQKQILEGTVSFNSSGLGIQTSLSKMRTRTLLTQLGFLVPKQILVKNVKQISMAIKQIGFPLVLKSDVGAYGSRVYSDLRTLSEVVDSFNILQTYLSENGLNHAVFVEAFVQGKVYRVEVVNGAFFDAYEMIPASITGDGKHTIQELVSMENQKLRRDSKFNAFAKYVTLRLDAVELQMLKKQNMEIDSVPEKDKVVRLRANSNWTAGGTFDNVSALIHSDNKLLAERIASVLKIELIGIDVITDDIGKSYLDEKLHIIEVNHEPDILGYFDDITNKFINVSDRLIERMIPNVEYGDVPVIVFKATEVANEVEIFFEKYLNELGYCAGLVNQNGLFVDGKIWAKPEQINYQNPGLQILSNETVGAAIIDYKSEILADFGLGSGGCDISIVLDTKDENVVTNAWPTGLRSSEIDRFLCVSSRLVSIVWVNTLNSVDLCKQCPPEKLFVLFLEHRPEEYYFIESNINRIYLLDQSSEALLIEVVYHRRHFKKWLKLSHIQNRLSYLAIIAALLVLKWEMEEIFSLLENGEMNFE